MLQEIEHGNNSKDTCSQTSDNEAGKAGQSSWVDEGADTLDLHINPEDEKQFQEEVAIVNRPPWAHRKSGKYAKNQEPTDKELVMVASIVEGDDRALTNDEAYISVLRATEKEKLKAKDELLQAEREAKVIQEKLEAQEHKRQRLLLQQQTVKNAKKITQAKKKYERDLHKFEKN